MSARVPTTRAAATVVIPVWNLADVTGTCLGLLRATLGPDDEVVVVDNGSTDHTARVLARHRSWVRVVTHPENLGFAAGCNAGAALATTPVVVFLNNDTLPVAGWLDDLLHPFADQVVGATGPMSNNASGWQVIDDDAYEPSTIAEVEARALTLREQHGRATFPVERLIGFCMAVRRSTFEALGGFDTAFGIGGCEDDDLSARIRRAGQQLLVVPGAFVHHTGHQTFDANRVDLAAVQAANEELLARKEAAAPALSVLLWCGDSLEVLLPTLLEVIDADLPDDVELVLLTPDESVVEPVVAQMSGAVTVVRADAEAGAWAAGLMRATGSRRALIRAGEELDAGRLGQLVAAPAGAARPTFVGARPSPPGATAGTAAGAATTAQAPGAGAARVPAPRAAPPLVSVIVRTFNRPAMLARCLEHLDRQRFTAFEVVVVNDAGADVAAVVAAFPELATALVTNDVPAGRAGALDAGLAAARGELVCIVDDDDVVYPEHLSALVAASSGTRRAVYSIALEAHEDADGQVLARRVVHDRAFDRRALLAGNFLPVLTVLFPRREALAVGGFDEGFSVLEDWDFWLRLSAVLPFEQLPQITCEYRLRGDRSNTTAGHRGVWVHALRAVDAAHPSDDAEVRAARAGHSAAWGRATPAFERTLVAVSDVASARDAVRRAGAAAIGARPEVTQVVAVLPRDEAGEAFAREHAGADVDVVLVAPVRFTAAEAERIATGRALGAAVSRSARR